MAITRTFPIVLSDDVATTRDFYMELLGFEAAFDSDWFVDLTGPEGSGVEIGIWQLDHELIPTAVRHAPQGVIINVVVTDVDAVHEAAVAKGLPIVQDMKDEGYGQRHFLTRDPAGTVVDISSPIPMSEAFKSTLA